MDEFTLQLSSSNPLAVTPTGGWRFRISPLVPEDAEAVVNIIRRNLDSFEEAGSVLAASFRRLENIFESYNKPGNLLLVVKDLTNQQPVGCVGLGPLAELPTAEGIGEIRDLVVEKDYRCLGLGRRLLKLCLQQSQDVMGYHRLYLETTPQMHNAQKLFLSFGFQPVTSRQASDQEGGIPCYYMLDRHPAS